MKVEAGGIKFWVLIFRSHQTGQNKLGLGGHAVFANVLSAVSEVRASMEEGESNANQTTRWLLPCCQHCLNVSSVADAFLPSIIHYYFLHGGTSPYVYSLLFHIY